jgi:hypothetical protein
MSRSTSARRSRRCVPRVSPVPRRRAPAWFRRSHVRRMVPAPRGRTPPCAPCRRRAVWARFRQLAAGVPYRRAPRPPRPAVLCAVRVFAAPRATPAAVESRACGSQRCDGLLQFLCSASWSSTVRWVLSSSNTSSRCACAVVIASVSSFRVANARAGGWCSFRRRTSARPRLSTTTPSGPPVRPASHAACWQLLLRPPPSAADCILPRPMHGSDK